MGPVARMSKAGARAAGAMLLAVSVAGCAVAEPVEIVALGDSLTAGYGLPEGQGFVPQLQGWLGRARRGRHGRERGRLG